ncbi:hypothetical protein ABZP36_020460 [Zizania latifolia]
MRKKVSPSLEWASAATVMSRISAISSPAGSFGAGVSSTISIAASATDGEEEEEGAHGLGLGFGTLPRFRASRTPRELRQRRRRFQRCRRRRRAEVDGGKRWPWSGGWRKTDGSSPPRAPAAMPARRARSPGTRPTAPPRARMSTTGTASPVAALPYTTGCSCSPSHACVSPIFFSINNGRK